MKISRSTVYTPNLRKVFRVVRSQSLDEKIVGLIPLVLIFYFQHQILFPSVLRPSHFQFSIAYSMQKLVRTPGEVVTMVDVFQAVGTVPVANGRLNSLVSTGVIL